MTVFNLTTTTTLESTYQSGLLPQRNQKGLFYRSSSCRSNLTDFSLSSENRRILNKTSEFNFKVLPLNQFSFTPTTQKQIHQWLATLQWDFPIASVKTIFNNHIFNQLYLWSIKDTVVAYAICLVTPTISHIAYVFYNPIYARSNLPIRMVLQCIIDSQTNHLSYCYLGQFSETNGFYKRNMPGFEYFANNRWIKYTKDV